MLQLVQILIQVPMYRRLVCLQKARGGPEKHQDSLLLLQKDPTMFPDHLTWLSWNRAPAMGLRPFFFSLFFIRLNVIEFDLSM